MSRLHIIGSQLRNDNCADFNGTNEYMSRTGTLSFRSDTAGAWSMWVRLDNTFGADGFRFVWTLGTSGTNRLQFGTRRISATGSSTFFSFATAIGATTRGYSATTTALAANTWYHVVFQSNGTAYSCSINGVSQTITQWTGTAGNTGDWFGDHTGTSPWFTVGVQNASGAIGANFWEGRLDEFVYLPGRVFTAGEVTEIYNSGVRMNPHRYSMISSLTTWYRMGDSRDSATTVFDELSGANDLTLVNMDASNYVAP
jgi:hypothetical protein